MSDLDNKGISEESALSKMQWISDESGRKESVTGAKLRDMEASLSHAYSLISEWDRLETMIAQYQQEMIKLGSSVQQIGSTLANNPQADAALQQMKEYQARLHRILEQEQDVTAKMGTVAEELNESRKTLKENISNLRFDLRGQMVRQVMDLCN